MSRKNTYSHSPVRDGRDSSRVMLTPFLARGASSSCMAPDTLRVDNTSEVLSLPEGATSCREITTKRVVLFGSSSMLLASTDKP